MGPRPADIVGEWRSLVAHLLWEQRVAGSNPVSPTTFPLEKRNSREVRAS